DWAIALSANEPDHVATLAAAFLAPVESERLYHLAEAAQAVLQKIAEAHPQAVMKAIGDRMADASARVYFHISVFRGLFESIGLGPLSSWAKGRSVDDVSCIGRHLPSPFIDSEGTAVVPALTAWYFEEHGDDE